MYCEGSEHKEWETPQFGRGEDRYDKISNWALSLVHDCDLVFLEDYALGAKGKVFNLGENGGLLKWKIICQTHWVRVRIFQQERL